MHPHVGAGCLVVWSRSQLLGRLVRMALVMSVQEGVTDQTLVMLRLLVMTHYAAQDRVRLIDRLASEDDSRLWKHDMHTLQLLFGLQFDHLFLALKPSEDVGVDHRKRILNFFQVKGPNVLDGLAADVHEQVTDQSQSPLVIAEGEGWNHLCPLVWLRVQVVVVRAWSADFAVDGVVLIHGVIDPDSS